VLVLGLVGAVAGGALRNADPTLTVEHIIKSIRHEADDSATICLEADKPSDTIILVKTTGDAEVDYKEADDDPLKPLDSKCIRFSGPDLKPDEGPANLAYSLFLGSSDGVMAAHATLDAYSDAVTLKCGDVDFERTAVDVGTDTTDCVNADAATSNFCFKKKKCSVTGTDAAGGDVTVCKSMTKDHNIGYAKSLSYEGIIKLGTKSGDDVIDATGVTAVIVVSGANGVDVNKVTYADATGATITDFQRRAGGETYTVCAVKGDKFAESTIEDVNIVGEYSGGYYQFGFKYPEKNSGEHTAKSEGSSSAVTIDCGNLVAGPTTRCYGYLQESDASKDLELTYTATVENPADPTSTVNRQLTIIAPYDRLTVASATP